jgi:hypothetical protein
MITALCLAQTFGNFLIQFQQARIVTNWRCRLKSIARAHDFIS